MRAFTLFLVIILSTALNNSWAQNQGLPFRLFVPEKTETVQNGIKDSLRMLVFLHGSGERGSDNEAQLKHGSAFFERLARVHNTLVLVPQCPENLSWHNGYSETSKRGRTYHYPKKRKPNQILDLLEKLVDSVAQAENIQPTEIMIGGLSMGGMGTLELLRRRPKFYRKAFVICGGGHPALARQMGQTPVWFFHGEKDDVVLPKYAQRLHKRLKRRGIETKFTLYPEVNHNSWDLAFEEQELIPWLMQ